MGLWAMTAGHSLRITGHIACSRAGWRPGASSPDAAPSARGPAGLSRQLLTESVVLSLTGGVLDLAVTAAIMRATSTMVYATRARTRPGPCRRKRARLRDRLVDRGRSSFRRRLGARHLVRTLPTTPTFVRLRLLAGRFFTDRDAAERTPRVMVVSESFAREAFGGEAAVGQRLAQPAFPFPGCAAR